MKPRLPIRRFDVFAEYNRLQALKKGQDDAHAKGYGLWVAKVVASGGGRRGADGVSGSERRTEEGGGKAEGGRQAVEGRQAAVSGQRSEDEWHMLGDEAQTDELFDKEIVRRMGEDFYRQVFAPAMAAAFEAGKSYEGIRDTIRKEWKP